MSFTRLAALLFCIVGFLPAQTVPPPLPPAAQEALNKGVIAAKLPDYLLAIRYFEEARQLAPSAPEVFYNLGLAESKIPGRELRAMAWFGAYLTAYPHAPNAAAVKEPIAVLEVRSQSNLSRLIQTVQDAAGQIPQDHEMPTMGRDKEHILYQVSNLWARSGDIARAQKIAELIVESTNWRDYAYEAIASAQFEAGDIAGASQTAGRIHDNDKRNYIQEAIVELAAKTEPTSKAPVEVREWLGKMGVGTWQGGVSDRPWIVGPLTNGMFLDLGAHLKSLPPPSKDIYAHFWSLQETAEKIVNAQKEINQMLKTQNGK